MVAVKGKRKKENKPALISRVLGQNPDGWGLWYRGPVWSGAVSLRHPVHPLSQPHPLPGFSKLHLDFPSQDLCICWSIFLNPFLWRNPFLYLNISSGIQLREFLPPCDRGSGRMWSTNEGAQIRMHGKRERLISPILWSTALANFANLWFTDISRCSRFAIIDAFFFLLSS